MRIDQPQPQLRTGPPVAGASQVGPDVALEALFGDGRSVAEQAQPELPASAERRDRVWSGYVRGNGGGSPAAAAPDTSADAKPKDSAKK